MKEIVNRLQENRQVELAKSILESHGYKVSKLKEEYDPFSQESHVLKTKKVGNYIIEYWIDEEGSMGLQVVDKDSNPVEDPEIEEFTYDKLYKNRSQLEGAAKELEKILSTLN